MLERTSQEKIIRLLQWILFIRPSKSTKLYRSSTFYHRNVIYDVQDPKIPNKFFPKTSTENFRDTPLHLLSCTSSADLGRSPLVTTTYYSNPVITERIHSWYSFWAPPKIFEAQNDKSFCAIFCCFWTRRTDFIDIKRLWNI